MGKNSRMWIEKHRRQLEEKYDNKMLIVSEDKILKVLDSSVDPDEINEIARSLCKGKDWSYTYVCKKKEWIL